MEITNSAAAPRAEAVARSEASDTAHEFEAMLMGQMVNEMLSTVKIGGFGGGHAEEQWRSVFADAIGERIASKGGTGIARQIENAIARYRESAQS